MLPMLISWINNLLIYIFVLDTASELILPAFFPWGKLLLSIGKEAEWVAKPVLIQQKEQSLPFPGIELSLSTLYPVSSVT
jgi:hypothetical protein